MESINNQNQPQQPMPATSKDSQPQSWGGVATGAAAEFSRGASLGATAPFESSDVREEARRFSNDHPIGSLLTNLAGSAAATVGAAAAEPFTAGMTTPMIAAEVANMARLANKLPAAVRTMIGGGVYASQTAEGSDTNQAMSTVMGAIGGGILHGGANAIKSVLGTVSSRYGIGISDLENAYSHIKSAALDAGMTPTQLVQSVKDIKGGRAIDINNTLQDLTNKAGKSSPEAQKIALEKTAADQVVAAKRAFMLITNKFSPLKEMTVEGTKLNAEAEAKRLALEGPAFAQSIAPNSNLKELILGSSEVSTAYKETMRQWTTGAEGKPHFDPFKGQPMPSEFAENLVQELRRMRENAAASVPGASGNHTLAAYIDAQRKALIKEMDGQNDFLRQRRETYADSKQAIRVMQNGKAFGAGRAGDSGKDVTAEYYNNLPNEDQKRLFRMGIQANIQEALERSASPGTVSKTMMNPRVQREYKEIFGEVGLKKLNNIVRVTEMQETANLRVNPKLALKEDNSLDMAKIASNAMGGKVAKTALAVVNKVLPAMPKETANIIAKTLTGDAAGLEKLVKSGEISKTQYIKLKQGLREAGATTAQIATPMASRTDRPQNSPEEIERIRKQRMGSF